MDTDGHRFYRQKAPSSKVQAPGNIQIPIIKPPRAFGGLGLVVLWCLDVGAWSFI
jgi:hypothetical protein